MTRRRALLIGFGATLLSAPLACFAQQRGSKVARIGLLDVSSASNSENRRQALLAGLRDLGLVEGKNIIIEYRWAEGEYERLPGLAAELVQMKVDVIVAVAAPATRAAKQATTTIPIVTVGTSDPVGTGLVASLSRPGRNITGLSSMNVDLSSKYLELLRAAVARLARVTVLTNPASQNHPAYLKRIQTANKTNDVKISSTQASTESDIEGAFSAMKQERAGALIVLPDQFFAAQARRIVELATQQRLPTMFWSWAPVESGGLMSYGLNPADNYYRAATYVDKILKGTKPGDLPIEQPTRIELVINLKTAKAIGLTIPQDLLLRADKVIE